MPDDLTPQSPELASNESESTQKHPTEQVQRVINKLETDGTDDKVDDHTAETLVSGRQQFENALAEMRRKANEMAREQVKRQTGQLEIPETPPVSELVEQVEESVATAEEETVIEVEAIEQPVSSNEAETQPEREKLKPTTLMNREAVSGKIVPANDDTLVSPPTKTPWTLEQFFKGEIDLDVELVKRFPNMPMMSRIKFRELGNQTGRKVATLSTQDESASLILDADIINKEIQLSFTFGSMITLRFRMSDLSDVDRRHWLELMQREQGGLAFLWGPQRWANDYLICITRKTFSNIYAFSPNNFEAAARLTPQMTEKLLDWLEAIWQSDSSEDSSPPQMLTW